METVWFGIEIKVDGLTWGGRINSRTQYPWIQLLTAVPIRYKATSPSLRHATYFGFNEQGYKSLEAYDMFMA